MFVKPKPGLQVRDPVSKRHLPSEGREVPDTLFWRRRLRSGDVAEVVPGRTAGSVVQVRQIPDSAEE